MKKIINFLFHRLNIILIFIVLQLILLFSMINFFSEYFAPLYFSSNIISLAASLYIINRRSNPSYKIAWITLLFAVPPFGLFFYLIFGLNKLPKYYRQKINTIAAKQQAALSNNYDLIKQLQIANPAAGLQAAYLQKWADSPPYNQSQSTYLSSGESKFSCLLDELAKAEKYIFIEYFIIQEGLMWDSILNILKQKAQAGVDVRIIYDDFGCILTLPRNYHKTLRSYGIKCQPFNRVMPVLSPRLNNRDHRKIFVIDGITGFTGGINLADEYINAFKKFGHWRDAAIMIKGEAVWSLTVFFLSMWDYICGSDEDYNQYRPIINPNQQDKIAKNTDWGIVQPYSDNPLDEEAVGENVYLNLIGKANRYIYIQTPYLVLDNETQTALINAAKNGVDVRIMLPFIPDKWYVLAASRAHYAQLLEANVRIYEYTPGFVHAKTFVADDCYGTVGTINLDYRSLFLHFECGCWLYKTPSIITMREDFLNGLELCQEIQRGQSNLFSFPRRFIRALLKAFAPLL